MIQKTLTITKKYFDLIASGEKKIEYRKDIIFYEKFLTPKPDVITFHYRKGIYLRCEIKKIVNIKRPKALEKSVFITTNRCYAIHISSYVKYTK